LTTTLIEEAAARENADLVSDARLRIVGVDPEANFGGGETQVLGLTRELIRRGHRAELICNPDGQLWGRATDAGLICHPLRVRNAVDVAAGLRLRAIVARERFDVVHFHTARAHALAPYTGGLPRVRVVTRRMDYAPGPLIGPYLYNRAVDGVIAISDGVARVLVSAGVRNDRIRVVHSGVDCDCFAPPDEARREAARRRLRLGLNDVAIGAVGALVPRKGHRVLIEAMALAHQHQESKEGGLRCFIAGAGPLREELTGQIHELRAMDVIQMIGPLEDARELLAALDIFAMPSLSEGLGVAAIEAMATGLPVVASAAAGLRELVEEGVNGFLYSPGDEQRFAGLLVQLAADPARRRAAGRESRRRAIAEFSVQSMAEGTLSAYQDLAVKSNARRRQAGVA
jgi:glycosyltransferase involved in cell wall biosynthesis